MEERIGFSITLILAGGYKSEQKWAIREKYSISTRMAEEYIARARKTLRGQPCPSVQEKREEAYQRYLIIINDDDSTNHEKLKAEKQIIELFGLSVPLKVAAAESKGNHLTESEAATRLSALAATLADRSRVNPINKSGGDTARSS